MNVSKKMKRTLIVLGAFGMTVGLTGCPCPECPEPEHKDIEFGWNIPNSQADCAAGTIFKDAVPGGPDLDGGPGIRDRDGGPGIRDRDGNFVTKYCLQPCVGDEVEAGPPIIDIHNSDEYVEAARRCEPGS